jgi:prepilin-type N-terminal cleavage/methylation domain-containing protein
MIDDREAGFTLIEVLVALAILAIAAAFGFRAISGGLYWLDRDGAEEHAVRVAEAELARVGQDLPLRDGSIDGRTAQGYSWQIAIAPYGLPAGGVRGHHVAVSVVWNEGRQARRVRLETLRLGFSDGAR